MDAVKGRTVRYRRSNDKAGSDPGRVAIITDVSVGSTYVSLAVFDSHGAYEGGMTEVPYSEEVQPPYSEWWCWPPHVMKPG